MNDELEKDTHASPNGKRFGIIGGERESKRERGREGKVTEEVISPVRESGLAGKLHQKKRQTDQDRHTDKERRLEHGVTASPRISGA